MAHLIDEKQYEVNVGKPGDEPGTMKATLFKRVKGLFILVKSAPIVGAEFSMQVPVGTGQYVFFDRVKVETFEPFEENFIVKMDPGGSKDFRDKCEVLGWTDLLPREQSGEFVEVGETEFDLIEPTEGTTATPATSLDVTICPPVEMESTDVVNEVGPARGMNDDILEVLKRTREPSKASPPPLPAPDSAPKAAPEMKMTLFATSPLEAMQNGNKGIAVRFKVENGLILVAIRDEDHDQSGEQLYATFMVGDGRYTTRSSFALKKMASKNGYGEYTLRFVSEHDWECVANLFRDGDYGVILSEEMKPDIPSVSAAARAEVAPQVRELFDDKTDAVQRDGRKDEEMSEDVRPRLNGRTESNNPTIAERRPKGKTLVLVGENGVEFLLDPEKGECTVGRDMYNDVVLDGMSVSSRHAVIKHDSQLDGWYLWDLDSSNGTKINGSPLEANRPFRFEAGDELSFGGIRFMVRDLARRVVLPRSNTEVVERRSKKRQDRDARVFGSGPNDMRPVILDRDRDEEVKKLGWVTWLFRIVVGLVVGGVVWMKFGHDFISVAIAILAGAFPVATWLIDKMAKSTMGRKLAENLLDEDTKLWDLIPGWAKGVIAFIVVTTIVLGAAYFGDKHDIAKRLRGAPQVTVVETPKPAADPKPAQVVEQPAQPVAAQPAQQPAAPVAKTVTECLALQRRGEALTCCDGLTDPNQAAPCKQLAGSKTE